MNETKVNENRGRVAKLIDKKKGINSLHFRHARTFTHTPTIYTKKKEKKIYRYTFIIQVDVIDKFSCIVGQVILISPSLFWQCNRRN